MIIFNFLLLKITKKEIKKGVKFKLLAKSTYQQTGLASLRKKLTMVRMISILKYYQHNTDLNY